MSTVADAAQQRFDEAIQHPWTFLFMFIFAALYVLGVIANECRPSLNRLKLGLAVKALMNFWVLTYLFLFNLLATISTSMALILAYDKADQPRIDFLPPIMVPLAVAAIGVFGFEFLFKKFIVGFGETKFDLNDTMKHLLTEARAATIRKAATL